MKQIYCLCISLTTQALSFAGTRKSESVKHILRLIADLKKIEFISFSEFVFQIILKEMIGGFSFNFKRKPHEIRNINSFSLINLISKGKLQHVLTFHIVSKMQPAGIGEIRTKRIE